MDALWKWFLLGGSAVLAFVVSLPAAIQALALMQLIDLATGLIASYGTGRLSSNIAYAGLKKKALAWVMLAVVAVLGLVLKDMFNVNINGFGPVEVVAIYFASMEAISVVENVERMGVKLPEWLTKGLHVVNEKFGNGE